MQTENVDQELIERFLTALGKQGCKATKRAIRDQFGLYAEHQDQDKLATIGKAFIHDQVITKSELEEEIENYYVTYPPAESRCMSDIILSAYGAIKDLRFVGDRIEDISAFFLHPKKVKKIKALHSGFEKILHQLFDEDIQKYFQLQYEDEISGAFVRCFPNEKLENKFYYIGSQRYEGQMPPHYRELVDRAYLFYHELKAPLASKRGRPDLKRLEKFVYHTALLYQHLTERAFTVDTLKGPKGEYAPMTEGMDFIWVAMDWLYKEAEAQGVFKRFSTSSIAFACERARTEIRKNINSEKR